jgi:hypothetical protein
MPSKQPKRHLKPRQIERVAEPVVNDDDIIASLVVDASARDVAALLHEFPRDSAFVHAIYAQFLEHGSTWPQPLRTQLADALARCRLHEEADTVRDA